MYKIELKRKKFDRFFSGLGGKICAAILDWGIGAKNRILKADLIAV